MAKLYFRYGTVGSAKTLNLLAVAHNYQQQGKKALLLKPELDDRWAASTIRSRAGLEKPADILINGDSELKDELFHNIDCVLIDEAQFLPPQVINRLREIATDHQIPVICYGLRTDFRTGLFEGARRLMELADSIEEVKTTCAYCNRKAIFNLKLLDGKATLAGPTIDLGAEEKYLPACHHCYYEQLEVKPTHAATLPGNR
ncbi:thymidine kinase [Acanthopleuribacter pedis]|uniref:Thymidine kinase n=1 Tax=Acanthopleuribacter pedis TaxID=442870 RepID=A0A8J7U156_9BACT|nr:thymidine kinase [Acanthopleuribacter pedis]MBO1317192.1 thymidine kinase [Acanthopleuribacter pedis]